jgi:hypothetical protein
MEPDGPMRVPGPYLRIAGRRSPAFRVFALAGLATGIVLTVGVAAVPRHVVALAVVAGFALCLGALALALRVAVTRSGDLVWSEHEAAVVAATLVVGLVAGGPAGLLDAVAVGLLAMLALGRLGHLLAGCCHGRPAGQLPGVRYGRAHAADGFPADLEGVPLVPVQVVEAAWAAALAGAGVVLVATMRPGTVFLVLLAGRALGRLVLERFRARRSRFSRRSSTNCSRTLPTPPRRTPFPGPT